MISDIDIFIYLYLRNDNNLVNQKIMHLKNKKSINNF
jgi:hypothetical protein